MIPCLAAARVKFSSPSGCPSFPRAVAVCEQRYQQLTQVLDLLTMYIGILDGCPKIVVDQSTFVTSRRTRGLNQILKSQGLSTRNFVST